MSCEFCDGNGTVYVTNRPGGTATYADCPEGCERPPFRGQPCVICGQPSGRKAPTPMCRAHREEFMEAFKASDFTLTTTAFMEEHARKLVAKTLAAVEVP